MKYLLMLILSFHVCASDSIKVKDPFIRLLPPGSPNTGGFMTLVNKSSKDLKLLKATSKFSKKLELHTLIKDGSTMKMREVKSITINANSKTELKPGGLHLMFMGLKKELVLNKKVKVKLHFNDSSHLDVIFTILNK